MVGRYFARLNNRYFHVVVRYHNFFVILVIKCFEIEILFERQALVGDDSHYHSSSDL